MKKLHLLLLVVGLTVLPVGTVSAQTADEILDRQRDKRAQTGMQFLSISMSPRAAALADAMGAVDMGSPVAMFYNPATMASLSGNGGVALSTVQWIADINYNSAALAFSPAGGTYGVFGLTVMAVDYGDLEGTIRADNEQGYMDTGTFSPTALAVGIGYAKSLSDRFALGGNVRYVHQDLGESVMAAGGQTQGNSVSTPVFDFGVFYRTGFQNLNIGMTVRNFSPAVTYEEEAFETPLLLSVAASYNVMDLMGQASSNSSLLLTAEAGHPRSFDEQVRLGGEYKFMDILSLRAGYVFPADEQGLNLGAGLNLEFSGLRFGADYAFSQFSTFDNVNRIGVQIGF